LRGAAIVEQMGRVVAELEPGEAHRPTRQDRVLLGHAPEADRRNAPLILRSRRDRDHRGINSPV